MLLQIMQDLTPNIVHTINRFCFLNGYMFHVKLFEGVLTSCIVIPNTIIFYFVGNPYNFTLILCSTVCRGMLF